jgi:hypothetical protein
MPTAVENAGVGVEAIIAVLRDNRVDPPSELGREFGGAIHELNFTTMPAEFHFGQEVMEIVHAGLLGVRWTRSELRLSRTTACS